MLEPGLPPEIAARRMVRPAPLREGVYGALLDLIINGTLRPGQHLVENELARLLGISRQPVREALQRLSAEGWVELRPAVGAFVHVPTEGEVDQLLAVRVVLETESARLAAQHATEDGIARLREILDRGTSALGVGAVDVDAVVLANADLHALVSEMSGNTVLAGFVAQVDRRVRWYYRPLAPRRGKDAWREHAGIIDAIAAGDTDGAARAMREHTERTRRRSHEVRTQDAAL